MSSEQPSADTRHTLEAIAHFVASVALLLFALMWGAVGAVGASLAKWDLLFVIAGIGFLVLVIMSIKAYIDGSRLMPWRYRGKTTT